MNRIARQTLIGHNLRWMNASPLQPRSARPRFRTARLAVLAVWAAAGTAHGALVLAENPGDYEGTLTWAGRERTWVTHVPRAIKYGKPMALVVALHGGGGRGEGMAAMSGLSATAEREGFIVAYPDGTSRLFADHLLTWNAGDCCGYARSAGVDDTGFIGAMLDALGQGYPVDPARIFVTGMSNGGMLAHLLGSRLAGRIAAIAPVAGALPPGLPRPERPVAVCIVHGTADQHVPYGGGRGAKALDRHAPRASVAEAVRYWREADGCTGTPVTESQGSVRTETWGGGAAGTEVVLVTIRGGGHAWPGGTKGRWFGGDEPTREVNVSDVIWEFFKRHARR